MDYKFRTTLFLLGAGSAALVCWGVVRVYTLVNVMGSRQSTLTADPEDVYWLLRASAPGLLGVVGLLSCVAYWAAIRKRG